MYAIIETGGKQYRIQEGDTIHIEKVPFEGNEVRFSHVLFLNDGHILHIGAPYLPSSTVRGEVVERVKGEKVVCFRYKRRKNYRRKVGHRQNYLSVKITQISIDQGGRDGP